METVFDLATPDELTELFSVDNTPLSAEEIAEERRIALEDPDSNLDSLASLYAMRGDRRRADELIALIQDDERRLCAVMMHHEFTG